MGVWVKCGTPTNFSQLLLHTHQLSRIYFLYSLYCRQSTMFPVCAFHKDVNQAELHSKTFG